MKKKNPSDEAFLKRLKNIAPEVLEADVDFDTQVIRVIQAKLARLEKIPTKVKRNETRKSSLHSKARSR